MHTVLMGFVLFNLYYQGPLLLTCISNHMPSKLQDVFAYPIPSFNGFTIEIWDWISNFIPHFIMDIITYSYCDYS